MDSITFKNFRQFKDETTFELTYASKKYKNTALQIWGNFEFTKMLQKAFGVGGRDVSFSQGNAMAQGCEPFLC